MTIWTMDQVRQARGLRGETELARDALARYGDEVLNECVFHVARALQHLAEPFAIVPHVEDFQGKVVATDDVRWTSTVRVWWEPPTRAVELSSSSERDGQLIEVRRVGEPLRVPAPLPSPWLTDGPSDPMESFRPDYVQYELAGWHEQERHWIYKVRS